MQKIRPDFVLQEFVFQAKSTVIKAITVNVIKDHIAVFGGAHVRLLLI